MPNQPVAHFNNSWPRYRESDQSCEFSRDDFVCENLNMLRIVEKLRDIELTIRTAEHMRLSSATHSFDMLNRLYDSDVFTGIGVKVAFLHYSSSRSSA